MKVSERSGSSRVLVSLALSAVLLLAFLVIEATIPEPMLPFGMFANRAFTATQIAAFGISSSMFAVFLYVTLYLQGVLGLSPVAAGAVYLPGTILMFLVAGATAQLLTKIDAGRALVASPPTAVGCGPGEALGVDGFAARLPTELDRYLWRLSMVFRALIRGSPRI